MKKLLVMVLAAACLGLLALPAVALADVVTIHVSHVSDVTVKASDDVYVAGSWADAYKPQAVYEASRWLTYGFSVYNSGGSLPLYSRDTDDGTWSDVMPYTGPGDPAVYWHPKWPHESFIIEWTCELGDLAVGDYVVVFDAGSTHPLMSWADVDYDGHPDLLLPQSFSTEFVLHVVTG